jgi:hypothetical protein
MKKLFSAAAVLAAAALLSGCANKNEDAELSKKDSQPVTDLSAYDYYNESSEEIVSVDSADEYDGVISASEAVGDAEDRGFDQRELTYYFDVSGEYLGDTEATEDSDDKAPMYQTMYVTENGDVWTVYFIGGEVYACPVSYIYEAELDHEIILSESDRLVSYDDSENKFYTTVPKKSVVELVVVDEVNAETLEKYTAEELEKL